MPSKYKVTFHFEVQEFVKEAIEIVVDKQTVMDVEFGMAALDESLNKNP